MIIITGTVRSRPESFEALKALCLAHARRSRGEDGCLRHQALIDPEQPGRIVFVEFWRDAAAVRVHFALPESRAFTAALRPLVAESPEIALHEAVERDLRDFL